MAAVRRGKTTVTIEDVARASGVSLATVSYVINNGPRAVRPETREKVERAILELRYEPSAVARGLRRKRMNAIGIVFPHAHASFITNPYYAPILDGILSKASSLGQNATLFTGSIWSDARHSLGIYSDGRCDGLLLLAPTAESDIIPALKTKTIPFVVVDEGAGDSGVSSVDVDDHKASLVAMNYLIALGHRRIAFLPGSFEAGSARRRMEAYRLALEMNGISYDDRLVIEGAYNTGSGWQRGHVLLRLDPAARPTAIFGGNDEIAAGVLQACRERGFRVPDQISIIGFDDTSIAASTTPPLTTVRQPLRSMGERATELLVAQIQGEVHGVVKTLLETEQILRASTAPPPAV
jgi:LacI family transcriptional regulator